MSHWAVFGSAPQLSCWCRRPSGCVCIEGALCTRVGVLDNVIVGSTTPRCRKKTRFTAGRPKRDDLASGSSVSHETLIKTAPLLYPTRTLDGTRSRATDELEEGEEEPYRRIRNAPGLLRCRSRTRVGQWRRAKTRTLAQTRRDDGVRNT
jgi:hypothetical protein